ncbi:hypothetical protein KIN20_006269 [Parelaphostrongylus tenuis]|uniref:Uncharacterized protein n=1 Tax=Parelaphostrongylus tenuis TaxID=148309 RepID=A0AAD5QFV2_PARTN|nr:hypothetical protein KIN20_006269 [Parelaphostrongylus tenuis]
MENPSHEETVLSFVSKRWHDIGGGSTAPTGDRAVTMFTEFLILQGFHADNFRRIRGIHETTYCVKLILNTVLNLYRCVLKDLVE